MDYARPKSKSFLSKRAVIVAVAVCALLGGGITLARIDFSTQRVERRKVTIDTVKRGTLEVKVHANGQLLPRNVEYIASQVTGRVAKALVKPGDVVKTGDVLVELGNPQLVASADEAKSAWEGAVNEAKAAEAEQRANLLNQEAVLTQAKFAMQRAQGRLTAETKLFGRGIVSEIDYDNSKLTVAQTTEQFALEQNRFKAIRDNVKVQLDVKQSRVDELAKALDRARDQVGNLRIVAGIDGVVQEISVDVGQQLQPGAPIGRIAQPDQLYAELRVPAREATEVQIGQNVVVDTRNGTVDGTVTRVDPAVTDGTVIVDVDLKGGIPAGARPQLPVEGVVYLSQLPDTLYVGRPAYVKSNAAIAVYKLESGGAYATRVPIQAGKVSLDFLQVLAGLEAGDRIITSETGEWQSKERILLN
ncbi:CusB/HlyD membrane fusion family barrel-sandwich protein [Tahibacter aquaticus]|uniref:CusB/HlyD membrane fusion family barrel-sandwich protein n=1 Tax=Tahibacter aquaticus TaxID=520092 RepID=A0A4R6YMK0_9GAMM|nr:HlyD family efflux transporter periplasmic adaptor subunit [Tahibacter aquaticus]TDR38510.1 CusB/HlyD membrane fusion family barrel-sandwich protein [Tahibacter aquaticus]